jgi:hypothetical protein
VTAEAVVVVGPDASGKTTVRTQHADQLGLKYNSDGQMISHALLDATWVGAQLAAAVPAKSGLSPLERLDRSRVADLLGVLLDEGVRKHRSLYLCVEYAPASDLEAAAVLDRLHGAAYAVTVVLVDTAADVSLGRAQQRYAQATTDWQQGHGLGAPTTSPVRLAAQRKVVARLASGALPHNGARVLRFSGDGHAPTLVSAA